MCFVLIFWPPSDPYGVRHLFETRHANPVATSTVKKERGACWLTGAFASDADGCELGKTGDAGPWA